MGAAVSGSYGRGPGLRVLETPGKLTASLSDWGQPARAFSGSILEPALAKRWTCKQTFSYRRPVHSLRVIDCGR